MLETERLYARPWRVDEDAPGACAMYGDPEMVRYIGGQLIADVGEQRERLAAILERNQRWGGRFGSWPLIERATGELVGTAILKPMPASGSGGAPSDEIEVGWHVVRHHWGRGFAPEAGRALLARGFDVLGLELLNAVVESPNQRSLAVARRIGMRHVGKTTRFYDHQLEHFQLTAAEWRQSPART